MAAQFDKALIASFEMGANALNNIYVQPVQTWKDWKTIVSQLCKKAELKEKFHTICVDTCDEAWTLCVKFICAKNGVESLGDVPYGKAYDEAKKEYHQTFRDLTMNGYGIIFVSHSTEKTLKNEKGEEYIQIQPALPTRPFDVVNKMVDIIAYIREITIDNGQRKRFMFLRDEIGDRFLAKSRFRYIQPKIELNYNSLVNAIYEAIDKECDETNTSPSEEENPFTILNFDELMQEAKILWTQIVSKELVPKANEILNHTFGKPTKFSEITVDQVERLNQVIMEIRDLVN